MLEFDPIANIFPLIEGKARDDFRADIRANGLREKIMLRKGRVLDGRNRYLSLVAHGEVAEIEHDGQGVFAGVPSPFAAVRYHSLAAVVVPDELKVTAHTGDVVMGARHRSLPLEGVQFHPESILTEHGAAMVRSFLA